MKAANAIANHGVTVLYAVPLIFEMLASIPGSYELDFSRLRLCISGSAALAPSVAAQFERRFGKWINMRYSGSHLNPAFTFNVDGPRDSVGRVDGLFPVVILDEQSRIVEESQIGEIAFDIERAPAEYREVLERNPSRRGRYLYSGDLGRVDAGGNLYIVGRKSPFIKVAGNRVEPAEVEAVLLSHPEITEAVVFPLNRGQGNEMVAAAVIPRSPLSFESLYKFCKERLDDYKCPRRIEFVTDLPRSEHGKVIRHLVETSLTGGGKNVDQRAQP
jgi:long-chain acyl-CoA synthetase